MLQYRTTCELNDNKTKTEDTVKTRKKKDNTTSDIEQFCVSVCISVFLGRVLLAIRFSVMNLLWD